MVNKILVLAIAAAFVALMTPSHVDAYGAAHVGYTHVGPNGVYHTGETAVAGPGGVYAGGRTEAYGAGGSEYRGGYEYGRTPVGVPYGGAAYGGVEYGGVRVATPAYGGTAYGAEARYGYVR